MSVEHRVAKSTVAVGWRALCRLTARDPRELQLAVLGSLWLLSSITLDLAPGVLVSATIWVSCLLAEWLLISLIGWGGEVRRVFDPRSPMITGLSLSLLLRSDQLWVFGLAGAVAIASKFIVRWGDRHLFNPANAGIVVAVLAADAWISPGQWGSWVIGAAALASLGLLVCLRASRLDLAVAFLGGYAGVLLLRALYLGDPLVLVRRELASGTLVLFTFFMITDPRTTPRGRGLRLALAAALVSVAVALRFWWFLPNAFLYALFFLAPLFRLIEEFAAAKAPSRDPSVSSGVETTTKSEPVTRVDGGSKAA